MKRRYTLLVAAALVATVWLPWLQPSAVAPAPSATGLPSLNLARHDSVPAAASSAEPASPAVPEGNEAPASTSPDEGPAQVWAQTRSHAKSRHSSPELAYLASQPAADAVVMEEEENGKVIYRADAASLKPDSLPELVQAALQKPDNEAAADLLAQFQTEADADSKLAILSASSLLSQDASTAQLLSEALATSQPQEVRIAALAFLSDQSPSLLATYVADPDPEVAVEAQSAYDNLSLPQVSVAASRIPPAPQNLARPPENINYAPTH